MVILFSANYESPDQLRRLCADIHALREPALIIAVDHEGGRVQRFRTGFTQLPAMRRLGELWDRDVMLSCRAASSLGYVLGAELWAHGVDFSFAPVLDIDWGRSTVIGDRGLHSDARVVAMLAGHLTHGMLLAGMANCGKHFPGHGWAEADSHVAVPLDRRPLGEILHGDAAPYRWLANALTGVMPAHVVYPKVDQAPAGFSRIWIEKVLRQDLGFCGAVFSDDLLMAGAGGRGGLVAGANAALDAGCDLVLVCNQTQAMDAVLDGLRWTPGPHFAARCARIRPSGPSPTMAELAASELYQRAQADLLRLAEALG
jgi:beta-N-acetylhexosaminidase